MCIFRSFILIFSLIIFVKYVAFTMICVCLERKGKLGLQLAICAWKIPRTEESDRLQLVRGVIKNQT